MKKNLKEFLALYRNKYLPVYSDIVSYLADKPEQVLVESENILAHIIMGIDVTHNKSVRSENITKAYNHLQRLIIDCYKILWVRIWDDIDEISKCPDLENCLTVPISDYIVAKERFRMYSSIARDLEINSVGHGPNIMNCLDMYAYAINYGYQVKHLFDMSKNPIADGDYPPDSYRAPFEVPTETCEEIIDRHLTFNNSETAA